MIPRIRGGYVNSIIAVVLCLSAWWISFSEAFVSDVGGKGMVRGPISPPLVGGVVGPERSTVKEPVTTSFPSSSWRSRVSSRLYTVESTRFRGAVRRQSSLVIPKHQFEQWTHNLNSLSQWTQTIKSMQPFRSRKVSFGLRLMVFLLLITRLLRAGGLRSILIGAEESVTLYSTLLETFPVVTKSITAGVIGGLGDFFAQWLENRRLSRRASHPTLGVASSHKTIPRPQIDTGNYNIRRGLSIVADGLFLSGPLMHFGYELFEHIWPISGGGTLAAMLHVVADTLLLDSIFIATTFWFSGWFEGFSLKQIRSQFRRDYVAAFKAGALTSVLVMPIELVCFRFLPLSFRVLAVNFIDIVWDAVISYMAHRSRGGEHIGDDQGGRHGR